MTTTNATRDRTDPGMVRPGRQALLGAVLLIVGSLVFAGLVVAGANVVSGVGLVVAVWGVALLVSGALQSRKGSGDADDQGAAPSRARGVVALVLAFIIPPVGVLVAAYSPARKKGGGGLEPLAIAIGAVLTVLYTFGIVLTAALARSPN